ncbi:MAG: Asp23/Gls24 family envelope stress response protein [Parachlamydiales bacterium]|nr:Asp23/Gls24 family envelope stress response protein [Parachlamydiales bacterium]
MPSQRTKVDPKEFELPDTVLVSNIETRVFHSIVLQCLSKIDGIALLENTLIDDLLGRDEVESIKGIDVEQEDISHAISVKVEINVAYGLSLPKKAEEIQFKIIEEITNLTGLHVSSVYVVFKNMIQIESRPYLMPKDKESKSGESQYSDDF